MATRKCPWCLDVSPDLPTGKDLDNWYMAHMSVACTYPFDAEA